MIIDRRNTIEDLLKHLQAEITKETEDATKEYIKTDPSGALMLVISQETPTQETIKKILSKETTLKTGLMLAIVRYCDGKNFETFIKDN